MNYLIFVRHGESRWNLSNKFTGWVDVPLSGYGIQEAIDAAMKLNYIKIDVAFTSELERAQETLLIILARQQRTGIFIHEQKKDNKWHVYSNRFGEDDIPIYYSHKLNERYYGTLQGVDKDVARTKYGERSVYSWRRDFKSTPPEGESLKDTYNRAVPYFKEKIIPEVEKNKNVIVSTHGNTLRALLKHIEGISDEKISLLEVPTAEPIIYKRSKGKLYLISQELSFNRPIYWAKPKGEKDNR